MSRPGSSGLRFGMFAVCVTRDPDAGLNSGKAKPLYDLLVSFADVSSRDTGQGYPYRETLATALDCSKQTVDRAADYLENEIGLVKIHRRKVEGKPDENDANLYEIFDAWLIHGVTPPAGTPPQLVARYGHTIPGLDVDAWVSERAPDFDLVGWQSAYDEKLRTQHAKREEQRRKERARRKKPKKGGGVMDEATPEGVEEEGGSVISDATGGVTDDVTGGVMSDALSRAGSPEPSFPDPDAPAGRSPVDGRSPSTSGGRAAGVEGGSAASGNTKPSPTTSKTPAAGRKAKHTKAQLDIVRQVRAFYPPEFGNDLPELPTISDAILSAMATDGRTPEQIGERILYRWIHHGYATKFHTGTLDNPVGAAIGMVRPLRRGDRYACPDARCENGRDIDTGEECRLCEVRAADRKAEQQRNRPQAPKTPPMPSQRAPEGSPQPKVKDCAGPYCPQSIPVRSGDLCGDCLEQQEAAEAGADLSSRWDAEEAHRAEQEAATARLAEELDEEAAARDARDRAEAEQRAAVEEEQRRAAAAEDARLREEFARQNPELAGYSSPAPF
ncbi:hypothetical protein [Streptomyces sp. NBC_01353]|uniref:hypothetical protein n=1 Tax=Streptomyces sp. NBC_01353 TaxID=2903835 RepID=UPI002E3607D7|nr:hypothetical protein [Streptomyces sp. NBC_01353]